MLKTAKYAKNCIIWVTDTKMKVTNIYKHEIWKILVLNIAEILTSTNDFAPYEIPMNECPFAHLDVATN